jgi:hypothetical protein
VLFQLDPPIDLAWWTEGRHATRAEVLASIEKGLPHLERLAVKDGDPGMRALDTAVAAAMKLLPAA